MHQQFIYLFALFLMWTAPISAQFITATQVESWKNKDYPSSDFNLNSAYVFLLNGHNINDLFEGSGMTKAEKKEIGIHKGDFPRYAYLALQMPDPSKEGGFLTYPMMIHDIRDAKNQQRVTHYGGRYLENIPDETLKRNDLYAKVHFESIKGNNDASFWKKAAKISLDLGKTATNLAAMSLTGNFLNISQQMLPQISQGLNSLQTAEESGKISSEFYIKLMSKELSALYEEKVVAASLYKLHWDHVKPSKSRFFKNATATKVDDLKAYVKSSKSVYILVVNTKSEYNTDHSTIAYTQSYIEKKSKDFRKIQNAQKRQVEKDFLNTLKQAVELRRQVDIFEKSLNTNYPDWLAFSRVTDLHYSIQIASREADLILSELDVNVARKYTGLYDRILTDLSLWFKSDHLIQSEKIVEDLLNDNLPSKNSIALYEKVQLLHFMRDRVAKTEEQGRIPKEIKELHVYKDVLAKLATLEAELSERALIPNPSWTATRKKNWLLKQATDQYPLCALCKEQVGKKISEIDNATFEQNQQAYKLIAQNYYSKLDCLEAFLSKMNQAVYQDSLNLSDARIEALQKDKETFESYLDKYAEIAGKNYMDLNLEELNQLLSQYYLNREQMLNLMGRLQPMLQFNPDQPCFEASLK